MNNPRRRNAAPGEDLPTFSPRPLRGRTAKKPPIRPMQLNEYAVLLDFRVLTGSFYLRSYMDMHALLESWAPSGPNLNNPRRRNAAPGEGMPTYSPRPQRGRTATNHTFVRKYRSSMVKPPSISTRLNSSWNASARWCIFWFLMYSITAAFSLSP